MMLSETVCNKMLSMIIFMEILFISIYSQDTFDCTGYEDDSYHPMSNTNDCRSYWHCIYVDTVYMRAIKRFCPAGTQFDARSNECEASSVVNCVPTKSVDSTTPRNLLSLITTTTRSQQHLQVLSNSSSQLTATLYLEQLLKKLIANKQKSTKLTTTSTSISTTTTIPEIPLTTIVLHSFKRRHVFHRDNLTINILTSHEHKIRQFPINKTHGLLIQCNEIRRRQLRDLIFHSTLPSIPINSSSNIFHYNLYIFILIFTKISD